MKRCKKIPLLMALAMMCGSAMNVSAVNITVDGNAEQYKAYRLLDLTTSLKSGDAHEAGEHTADCYNYAYTVNPVYREALESAIDTEAADTDADGTVTDQELIKYLGTLEADDVRTFADTVYGSVKEMDADATSSDNIITTDKQGYYLIVESQSAEDPDSVSLVMLDTAGADDIKVTSKEDIPTLEKKIAASLDISESGDLNEVVNPTDAVDAQRDETVTFVLTGSLPKNIKNYQSYKYIFHDTLSDGLELQADTIQVWVDGALIPSDGYSVSQETEDCSFEVAFEDILETVESLSADSTVVVAYEALVTADAISGNGGNPNDAYLEFSNNPYVEDSTSETPEDTVKVFQFSVVINKVDNHNEPLTGAEFTLYMKNQENQDIVLNPDVDEWESGSEDIPIVLSLEDEEWVIVDTLTVNEKGTEFTFSGLKNGQYKLVETKVPDGYNKADDVLFEIATTYDTESEDPQITAYQIKQNGEVVSEGEDAKFEISANLGTATGVVINSTGIQLPHTGEVGRAILLYSGCGAIVVSLLAVLVARKKENGTKAN